jgi:crotonobetainyl-CoA:carnitine CoA-transferase CaiB-like acyl-CoA transferase
VVEVTGLGELGARRHEPAFESAIRGRLAQLAEFFASRTKQDAAEAFAGPEACVTPVQSYEEMLESEHARLRGTSSAEIGCLRSLCRTPRARIDERGAHDSATMKASSLRLGKRLAYAHLGV